MAMICVYDIGNEDYLSNGNAVLAPKSCNVHEVAGGSFELSMIHPIDREGKWKHLSFGALIKAPVPVETIQSANVGMDVDVYKTLESASLREGPSQPTPITYGEWVYGHGYQVGDKVTRTGASHRNYKCDYWNSASQQTLVPPEGNSGWWTPIADNKSGSAELTKLAAGTEIYYEEAAETGWTKVSTKLGIIGYIRNDQIQFVRHETVTPLPERTVTDQLFRIYKRQKSSKNNQITVNARHVSYDLNGTLIRECDLALVKPAMAIMRMKDAWMQDYRGEIATNLSGDDFGTYTGNLSGKTGTYGFLDPDNGMIRQFGAKLFRDNWDIFIIKNDNVDRGFRLTYGVNLKGVEEKEDGDKLVTQVIPVAKDEDGNDLYLPELYIDSPKIDDYPVVMQERLKVDGQIGKDDGTNSGTEWTAETLYEEMRTKANERFSVDHADDLAVSVTIDFLMLGDTVEFRQYKSFEKVFLYDLVNVHYPALDIDLTLQVSEFEWDCISKRYTSIKIGDVFDFGGRTVTSYQIGNESIDYKKINQSTIDKIAKESTPGTGGSAKSVIDNDQTLDWNTRLAIASIAGKEIHVKLPEKPEVIDNLSSTAADKALSANMGKQLNDTKANITQGTWTAHFYDYETKKFESSGQMYWKIGKLVFAQIFIQTFPTTTFNSMLQVRNLPFFRCMGGNFYAADVSGQLGDRTIQESNVGVYVRPNFTGTINGGVFSALIIGYDNQ